MDYNKAKQYLLSKPDAIEDYPFGPDVMVPKIKGKMFATLSLNKDVGHMNLKCVPEQGSALRDIFSGITAAYHMNKKHWITLVLDGSIPNGEIERLVDQSYSLVVKNLTKATRETLELKYGKEHFYVS
jgi:predicted DNA-binding protein (MmcQ/YjbR family)